MAENGRKRRGRIPLAEKLAELDRRISAKDIELVGLKQQKADLIEEQREKARAMLAEVGDE